MSGISMKGATGATVRDNKIDGSGGNMMIVWAKCPTCGHQEKLVSNNVTIPGDCHVCEHKGGLKVDITGGNGRAPAWWVAE